MSSNHYDQDGHFQDLDAATFTNEDTEVGVERAVGVFASADSSMPSSIGMMSSMPTAQFSSKMGNGPSDGGMYQSTIQQKKNQIEVVASSSSSSSSARAEERCSITFPERPCFLVRTHFAHTFEALVDPREIVESVESVLDTFHTFDFNFFSSALHGESSMWKGKHIRGAQCCEVYVTVYTDGANHIVEANRVRGDSKPFMNFYKEFKTMVTKIAAPVKKTGSLFLSPLPSQVVADDQFLSGIKPIFSMSAEPFMEARLEGVKMLCELSSHETALLGLEECRTQVVAALERLASDEMDDVKQHGIMAVSNFVNLVDIPDYKTSVIANSFLLGQLLEFATDASYPVYDSIQARRESAYILHVLFEFNALATARSLEQSVGSQRLAQWMNSHLLVTDTRLRNYIASACDNYSKVKK